MGNPGSADAAACDREAQGDAGKPRTDRYSASRGHHRPAQGANAAYYARRFGVKLNPETQVVATLGSKEGFANVAQAITAPGDVVLCPQSELTDPCLWIPDGRRRDPLGAVGADAAILRSGRARHHPFDPEAAGAGGLLSLQSHRLCREPGFLQGSGRVREEGTRFLFFPISPMPKCISTTTIRRPRCCRCPARST